MTTTWALPNHAVEAQTAVIEFGCDTALFLMTDGLADPLGAGTG